MAEKDLQYWATIQNPVELLDALDHKSKLYFDDLRETGLLSVWDRSYRTYYGGKVSNISGFNNSLFESSRLGQGGKQGEKTTLKVNHFRNFIRHIHQLATSQKPVTQARATNSDYKSQAQTLLANGLVDYYWREKNVGNVITDVAELTLVYGEGFIHAPWDPHAGEMVMSDDGEGNPIYEGDIKYNICTPLDVVRDPSCRGQKQDWKIIYSRANRWDLAANYTALAQEILEASSYDPSDDDNPGFQLRGDKEPINPDKVTLKHFYHDRTDALPNGRLVVYLDNVVLFDGPLPYATIPVYRCAAQPLINTIYGYTPAFDLLGIQEGMDELHTALMSNNKSMALQSVWIHDTDKLTVNSLQGGMKLFKSEVKPEPLQLTQSAPETYNYLKILEGNGEVISGISSTVRGQPETSLKSGAALALVVSQSIQFASSYEESINRLIEDTSTGLIYNLRDFSTTDRVANIIGQSSRPYAKTFNAKADLGSINRVVAERVSALSKTISGRAEIAKNLLDQGMLENPKQYITVLTTGQLDPAIEGTQHKLLNIRAENEIMRDGGTVQALVSENHAMHIQEHLDVVENPEAKANSALITTVLSHVQEHLALWRSMDPALAMITGQQPPPPPLMPAPSASIAEVANPTQPVVQEAEQVQPANLPSMPEGSPPEAVAAYEQEIT